MTKKMTFEEALARLEQIVAKMDSGDLPLEDAIELFSEGSELSKRCLSMLEQASGKVEVLMQSKDGKTMAAPMPEFAVEDEPGDD